jgi:hypothetical protein
MILHIFPVILSLLILQKAANFSLKLQANNLIGSLWRIMAQETDRLRIRWEGQFPKEEDCLIQLKRKSHLRFEGGFFFGKNQGLQGF